MRRPIDYGALAAALLARVDECLRLWLPRGVERNGRWYVGDFDGSPGESANVNMATGQWIDNAAPDQDVGRDLISLYARVQNCSNHDAAIALMDWLGWERAPAVPMGRPAPAAAAATAPREAAAPAASEPAAPSARREPKWRAVVPVPAHAPAPSFTWAYRDKSKPGEPWVELQAVRTWAYRRDGVLFGHVARFERVNSAGDLVKDTLPLTWCENLEDGRGLQRWHWKTWDEPRPLYLAAGLLTEGRPVVLVEGEKCAEAAHQLLGERFDFVSWPGGCKAWELAAWEWLAGRAVIMWPDCDAQRERLTKAERDGGVDKSSKPLLPAERQPGLQAMVNIGTALLGHGCTVRMCKIPAPGAVADGWDVADAIAQGWDAAQVAAFIDAAVPFQAQRAEAGGSAATGSSGAAGGGGGSTPARAGAGHGGGAGDWRMHVIPGAKGLPAPVRENAALAMDGLTGADGTRVPGAAELDGLVSYNEFTNNVELTRPAPWGSPAGPWGESDELELGDWLVRQHGLPPMGRQTLEEAVALVARRHKVHPARAWFDGLRGTWDGTKRLRTWLIRCCREDGRAQPGEDESDLSLRMHDLADHDMLGRYLARVGTWTLMAIVARVMQPGVKFDYMTIFEGGQGVYKSTTAKILGLQWFADTGLILGDKDSYQNLQGILVYEWGELHSLTKSEVTKVKQFISSEKDRFRASFDRRPRDYPRQVVFIGTTNERHYLTDMTGNRRFWPVRVERPIDVVWLKANLAQMYAEALHYVEAGDRFHPTHREQLDLFDPQQLARTVDDSLEMAIRRYLYDEDQKVLIGQMNGAHRADITLNELLDAVGISLDKQTDAVAKKASAIMGRLGWERGKRSAKIDERRPNVYKRPAVEPGLSGSHGSTGATQPHAAAGADSDCPF